MQRVPAGFPSGMPGIRDEIEGAMQHAAQRGRQMFGGDASESRRIEIRSVRCLACAERFASKTGEPHQLTAHAPSPDQHHQAERQRK